MPKINVNGADLYYELHGSGDPLILIAGFNTDSLFWRPILPLLQKHFRVLVFDHRGAGKSDCPDIPYSIEMLAQDVLKLSDLLDLKRPHVLGHSMGGCVAQMLAYQHFELFDRFAICNSFIKFNPISTHVVKFLFHLLQEGISLRNRIEGSLPWIFSTDFLQSPHKIEGAINHGLKNPHPITLTGYKRQLEALLGFDSNEWFHQIEAPTLIINGMEDILCPYDSEKLAKRIRGAKLFNFPHMGHVPMIEEPKEFSRLVMHFFGMHDYPTFSLHQN